MATTLAEIRAKLAASEGNRGGNKQSGGDNAIFTNQDCTRIPALDNCFFYYGLFFIESTRYTGFFEALPDRCHRRKVYSSTSG